MEAFNYEAYPLFLNIFPSTLLDRSFLAWWDAHIPGQIPIVLELSENEPIRNWEKLKTVTKELQARDVKIAIDDMGTQYSFFWQWIELDPDFIKLDQYFAKSLSMNYRKQKTVRCLVDLLFDTTEIIIEGIETEEDVKAAEMLGLKYAQGYFLGEPSPRESLFTTHCRAK